MYIENPDEEQNQNQSSSSPSIGGGAGGASIGQGGTSTGGNPSTTQPIQANQPTQKFANVQDYLKANQPQGEAFGSQFVSTVGQGVGQAKSAIDTSAQNAQNQITSGTINANQNLINQAKTAPTSVANDADKLAEFQKEYNAEYSGPSSFESSDQYGNAANAATQAIQTGQELGSTGGREQLLQDVFGVYGQGNKGLDQTFLQNSSAYSNVAPLAQNFQSVQDYLKAAAGTTNTQATNAANTTAATKTAATGALQGNLTNFQNDLNSRVQTARDAAQAAADRYKKDFAAGNSAAVAKDLKEISKNNDISINNIQNYLAMLNNDYGVTPDIQNYNNYNPVAQINSANVASPEDYANAAAYQKLTGEDYSGVLNPANAKQAGTYKNIGNFDVGGLNNYIQGQVQQRDKEVLSGVNLIPSMVSLGSDAAAGQKLAQQYIDVFQRNGWGPSYTAPAGTPANVGRPVGLPTNAFDQYLTKASQQFVKSLGGDSQGSGQMSPKDPSVAGQRAFVNTLLKYANPNISPTSMY